MYTSNMKMIMVVLKTIISTVTERIYQPQSLQEIAIKPHYIVG